MKATSTAIATAAAGQASRSIGVGGAARPGQKSTTPLEATMARFPNETMNATGFSSVEPTSRSISSLAITLSTSANGKSQPPGGVPRRLMSVEPAQPGKRRNK